MKEAFCGDVCSSRSVGDITWTFYESGTLVIDGSGSTPDYWLWFNYKEDVKKVVVKEPEK